MTIADRLEEVRWHMSEAARMSGRKPGDVYLIAVSKRQPVAAIREAYAAGQRDFGENYLQELAEKQDALRDCPHIRWHFIGHLQSRKARELVSRRAWVHGVDSLSGIRRLSQAAAEAGVFVPMFLQVNTGGEDSKSGVAPAEVDTFAAAVSTAGNLDWRGLMTIPPVTLDEDARRTYFRALRLQRDRLQGVLPQWPGELSMGMSGDFEEAIAEGATWVRIGTAIFGARPTA